MTDPLSPQDAVALNQQMLHDAGAVISQRVRIMTRALCEPASADLAELTLMGSEKVEAFSDAAERAVLGAGAAASRIATGWTLEMEATSRAVIGALAASDPAEAAQLQADCVAGWWRRAAMMAVDLNADWARTQAEALAPVHAAVAANVRRLDDQ